MQLEKQKILLQYLVSSPDTFAMCKSIIKAEYFDPKLRSAVDFILTYYDKYNNIPSPDLIFAETSTNVKVQPITRDQIKYCAEQVEEFCKRKAVENAVLSSVKYINDGNYGKMMQIIQDAMTVSLNRDIGLDYFDKPFDRIERLLQVPSRITTGWKQFDDLIGGGIARTELLLFTANSGGGKSIVMTNLGLNFAKQKLNVVYLSLELSEELISQRLDVMFSGVPTALWKNHAQEIGEIITQAAPGYGKFIVKRMPSGTNANAIRSYLKEFELKYNFIPDVIISDYLDLMSSNEKVSADNVFEKDKRATEQFRDILSDYNAIGITASQQNRSAVDAEHISQAHIAGGISKINTADWVVSILMTPAMKAAGEIGFQFLKTRSSHGAGETIFLKWDSKFLRVVDTINTDDNDSALIQKVKNKKQKKVVKPSILDVMDDV